MFIFGCKFKQRLLSLSILNCFLCIGRSKLQPCKHFLNQCFTLTFSVDSGSLSWFELLHWWLQNWISWGGRGWHRLGSGWRPCCCCSGAALADTGPHTAPPPPQIAGRRTRRDTGAIRHFHMLPRLVACWNMQTSVCLDKQKAWKSLCVAP